MAETSEGIPLIGPTSQVNPIAVPLNAMASALNAAIIRVKESFDTFIWSYAGTLQERGQLAAPKLRNGITWLNTDNGVRSDRIAGVWIDRGPFAEVRGAAAITAGTNTINFPAGKFTVAPVVQLTGTHPNLLVVPRLGPVQPSKDSMQVQLLTVGGALVAGTIYWTATQATPTAAAG